MTGVRLAPVVGVVDVLLLFGGGILLGDVQGVMGPADGGLIEVRAVVVDPTLHVRAGRAVEQLGQGWDGAIV